MTREEKLHWLNLEIQTWENDCQIAIDKADTIIEADKEERK